MKRLLLPVQRLMGSSELRPQNCQSQPEFRGPMHRSEHSQNRNSFEGHEDKRAIRISNPHLPKLALRNLWMTPYLSLILLYGISLHVDVLGGYGNQLFPLTDDRLLYHLFHLGSKLTINLLEGR